LARSDSFLERYTPRGWLSSALHSHRRSRLHDQNHGEARRWPHPAGNAGTLGRFNGA
jgi:hypothetical protein